MTEYDIYVPATRADGAPIDETLLDQIKRALADAFGGYTHLTHHSEGAWRIAGATFREAVTIIRVLDDGTAAFDMTAYKQNLQTLLGESKILIIAREVYQVG